jgi:hypothetical protein
MSRSAAAKPRTTGVVLGSETSRDFSTQTKADFTWPETDGRQAKPVEVKSTLRLGHDSAAYLTETQERFGRPAALDQSKSTLPRNNHSVVELGTEGRTFSTTHREGFPERALDLSSLTANKTATQEINRAHFILGDEPASFATTYSSTLAQRDDLLAATASSSAKGAAFSPPKSGKLSSIHFGTDERPSYETTNRMPLHAEYKRREAHNPTAHLSSGSAGAGGASDVFATLTTSGKPLSAVAFGYDRPDYRSETMVATGQLSKTLREPYVPRLVPRYVTDHPALHGVSSPTKASERPSVLRE